MMKRTRIRIPMNACLRLSHGWFSDGNLRLISEICPLFKICFLKISNYNENLVVVFAVIASILSN